MILHDMKRASAQIMSVLIAANGLVRSKRALRRLTCPVARLRTRFESSIRAVTETTLADVVVFRIMHVEPFVRTYVFRSFFLASAGNQSRRDCFPIRLL